MTVVTNGRTPAGAALDGPFIWAPVGGYPGVHAGEGSDALDRIGKAHSLGVNV
jgi:hypothetical protein